MPRPQCLLPSVSRDLPSSLTTPGTPSSFNRCSATSPPGHHAHDCLWTWILSSSCPRPLALKQRREHISASRHGPSRQENSICHPRRRVSPSVPGTLLTPTALVQRQASPSPAKPIPAPLVPARMPSAVPPRAAWTPHRPLHLLPCSTTGATASPRSLS